MRIPVFHVDAFTNQPFSGNPAAVCPLQAWLDDELLRKVATENNLSETAFFVPKGDVYELRWFGAPGEVKLCGHATLAAAHVVITSMKPAVSTIRFETRHSGSITVHQDGGLLSMNFPALLPAHCTNLPDDLIRALGPAPPPTDVLEVNETYIVVYASQAAVQEMRPDFARLQQLHPYTVAVTAPGAEVDFVSRYFKPSYGMPEDPVTGSAHCALTPYWTGRLGKSQFLARQLSERGGELWCEMAGARVILKGHAVLTVEGSMVL